MDKLREAKEQIEEELEKGEWKKAEDHNRLEEALKEGAKSVLKKRPISIRLSERDIMLLKKKSREIGIPYQTIIAVLVRQYVEGKIRIEL